MIKETKIGNAVIVEQTTFYYYPSKEDQKNDNYSFCTSDRKKINEVKRQLRNHLKKTKNNSLSNVAQ